ncbi:MAG: hypothetical protein HY833_02015 [Candidatus Aenigmarchaeota archaeon]|nr:hypothetical protein [Candidatus Aenigmarchaeota archaeon]
MMTIGSENVGAIRSYQESLNDFTRYIMENPGRSLTVDLTLPDTYTKSESENKEIESMNDYLRGLKNYNKFNLMRSGGGIFMSRIIYDTLQTVAYADINSFNGALDEISSAIVKSENSQRYG